MTTLSRRRTHAAPVPVALSKSVQELCAAWGLALNSRDALEGAGVAFAKLPSHPSVEPSSALPSIAFGDDIFYLMPDDAKLPIGFRSVIFPSITSAAVLAGGIARLGPDEWPENDGDISRALLKHFETLTSAKQARKSQELLERELASDDLYASRAPISDTAPMLVDDFMRERGVSVVYGAFDEFKTTVVLDIVAHVAMGAPWQGRQVKPRPVIWYALEGADEIPVRLRALESRLKKKSPLWGDHPAPITCRDRKPEEYIAWRTELRRIYKRWEDIYFARRQRAEVSKDWFSSDDVAPVAVIDMLSIALGSDDEKGPRAAGFIAECLDLLKQRDDLADHDSEIDISCPAASHVIIIHHQTKTGIEFAGHRAIAANTQGLYRVHRHGRLTDSGRPYAGQITPYRVKGIPRPAPIRFEIEVVSIEGTSQTAVILKDKAGAIPAEFEPALIALRGRENHDEIAPAELNECLDMVAAAEGREGAAVRKYRQRMRKLLEDTGAIEPIEGEDGKVAFYCFHDGVRT